MLITAHTPPLHHNIVYVCDERGTVDLFMAILYSRISFQKERPHSLTKMWWKKIRFQNSCVNGKAKYTYSSIKLGMFSKIDWGRVWMDEFSIFLRCEQAKWYVKQLVATQISKLLWYTINDRWLCWSKRQPWKPALQYHIIIMHSHTGLILATASTAGLDSSTHHHLTPPYICWVYGCNYK